MRDANHGYAFSKLLSISDRSLKNQVKLDSDAYPARVSMKTSKRKSNIANRISSIGSDLLRLRTENRELRTVFLHRHRYFFHDLAQDFFCLLRFLQGRGVA